MKVSASVFSAGEPLSVVSLFILVAFDLMVILLSVILFPFLWKD
jgi:hypothetical protein